MYRFLLLLLPRHRRATYGAEMADVFDAVCALARKERGWTGVMSAWVKEALSLARFSTRERLRTIGGRLGSDKPGRAPVFGTEFRWAWRGVRSRGWTAAFSVGLLAIAIAANGIVFSVTDSLMFRRTPYPDADRLIYITPASGAPFVSLADVRTMAARIGLVQHVTGYNQPTIFLTGEGTPERVSAINATPELFSALRVFPRWGRAFTSADVISPDSDTAVISEALAVARFGDPASAVGRVLDTTEVPIRVVGVMPAHFRFPNGGVKIWRGFSADSPLAASNSFVMALARLQDGRDLESTATMFRDSYAGAEPVAGRQGLVPRPYVVPPRDTTRFWALLGAVACLLLAACSNIASVELAAAFSRTRTYAIQRSLGASRWLLARGALWEGAIIVGAAAVIGTALVSAGISFLGTALPEAYGTRPANPIDFDRRVVMMMIGVACLAWIATSLPVVLFASGANLGDALKASHSQAGSRRAALGRRSLTVVQVAVAVLLLVGGVLYVRTYLSRLDVDKGFDSTHLASISLTVPPQMMGQRRAAVDLLLERLTHHAGILGVTNDRPPQDADSPRTLSRIEIDGTWHPVPDVPVASKEVSVNYHAVLQMPAREGRLFATGEPPAHVIIDQTFAKHFWPGGAEGHSFRRTDTDTSFRIVGVVDQIRTAPERGPGSSDPPLLFYLPRQVSAPRPQVAPTAPRPAARRVGGPAFAFIPLTVRLDSPGPLAEVLATVRSAVPQFAVRAAMVEDDYAEWEAETLLQAQVITAFGILAVLITTAGVYGVMSFLVVSRTRELGVRMALGAGPRDLVTLVFGSTARMMIVGVSLGLAASFAASRYIEAELFGVSPTDPLAYGAVAVLVMTTAGLATWWPARQAARVDPAITLRAD